MSPEGVAREPPEQIGVGRSRLSRSSAANYRQAGLDVSFARGNGISGCHPEGRRRRDTDRPCRRRLACAGARQ
jgi:hypothetical protein